ncbi:MAG: tRNA (uridine(34)/cytosine(34)/5-carboxymethylaminomethyluridine(34)-2'-O)-methyltransferase TrmL [Epulopiscium sp. Nele67-Bin004]|nr:MAG: tRNA (uridine(34)/cytosine(34)/5-carboxymethylaminomethyluridine(34)-2'-O)-methyltransferase TrmL [Epulopiscium sp. Nele67-Bin004]
MNIVLLEPEIPQNTGNIARTCVATGARLHLIEPMGFKLDEKSIRRAGLDYWELLDITIYKNFDDFVTKNSNPKIYMATTKSKQTYCDVKYEKDAFVMFGKESAGIPEELLLENKNNCIRIPMKENIRSLNLSNSVSIVVYEALRQQNFDTLESAGQLHRHSW